MMSYELALMDLYLQVINIASHLRVQSTFSCSTDYLSTCLVVLPYAQTFGLISSTSPAILKKLKMPRLVDPTTQSAFPSHYQITILASYQVAQITNSINIMDSLKWSASDLNRKRYHWALVSELYLAYAQKVIANLKTD